MWAAVVATLGWRASERRSGGTITIGRLAAAWAASLLVIAATSTPLDRLSMQWLAWHMVLHVVLMFYVPLLIVLASPGALWSAALPAEARERWSAWTARRGRLVRILDSPTFGVVAFNVVMVAWHLPAAFNWAMGQAIVHEVLMTSSFVLAGVGFWRTIVVVPPRQRIAGSRFQVVAILATAFVMLLLAMTLGVVASHPWYGCFVAMHGMVAAMHDQHFAAGVLWVCGDLWAIPALVVVGLRVLGDRGGASVAVDRYFGRA